MQIKEWFIKNETLLIETSKCNDLLNRERYIHEFSEKVGRIKGCSIMWLIWDFGIGKSTLINNVKELRISSNENEKWIEFDAWKYPDRKNLWEWFILDFAKQVDEKIFNKAKKEIDGEQYKDQETLMKTIWSALWTFLPWWNIVSKLSHFFKSSPARRVFEIQDIFIKIINNISEEKIIIVIEDIDRSWDAGVYFLETLKQFITNNEFWKEILIIVPMGTSEYYNNIDSYLKPIDYFDFFKPEKRELDGFIKNVFIEGITENEKNFRPLKEFLEWLLKYYPKNINLRKLKIILRKANQNHLLMFWKYNGAFDLDRRLNIIFEVLKYIEGDEEKESLFNVYKNNWIDSNSLFWAYIYNLVGETERNKTKQYYSSAWNTLFKEEYNESLRKNVPELITTWVPIEFNDTTTSKEIIWWWFDDWSKLKRFIVPNKYLEY